MMTIKFYDVLLEEGEMQVTFTNFFLLKELLKDRLRIWRTCSFLIYEDETWRCITQFGILRLMCISKLFCLLNLFRWAIHIKWKLTLYLASRNFLSSKELVHVRLRSIYVGHDAYSYVNKKLDKHHQIRDSWVDVYFKFMLYVEISWTSLKYSMET